MSVHLRPATRDDAGHMAALANIAGAGIPDTLWARRCRYGQSPRDYGAERAASTDGTFSWRNAMMAELHGEVAGMVITQPLGAAPTALESDTHPILRPMIRLENEALQTREVNMLATYPALRRHGVGTALLETAEQSPGKAGMSILVTDGNAPARAFAAHHGYRESHSLPLVRGDWQTDDANWILLRKP